MAVGTVVTRLPALHSRIKRSVEPSTLNELGDRPDQSYRRAVQAQTPGGAPDGLGVKVMTPQPDVRMRFRRFGDHPMDLAFVLSHPAAVLPVFKRSGEHPMDLQPSGAAAPAGGAGLGARGPPNRLDGPPDPSPR